MSQNYDMSVSERQEYRRRMLRAAFVSLFWNAYVILRDRTGLKLNDLAKVLGKDKSIISRWFSGEPNWTIDTIADIAGALNLELNITARDKETGIQVTDVAPITRVQRGPIHTDTETDASPSIVIIGHFVPVTSSSKRVA